MTTNTSRTPTSPIGPISSGENVTMILLINGVYYVPIYDTSTNDIAFTWFVDEVVNSALNNDTIMQFAISGTYSSLELRVINTTGIGRRVFSKQSGSVQLMTLVQSSSASTVIGLGSDWTVPPLPGVVYSSAAYAPVIAGTNTRISVTGYTTSSQFGRFTGPFDVYFVPTTLYRRSVGDATSSTCSVSTNDALLAIKTFLCTTCTLGQTCGNVEVCTNPVITTAWTRVNDCQVGNPFEYCKVGQTCGACYGSCGNSYEECRHTVNSQLRGASMTADETNQFVCNSSIPFSGLVPAGQALQPIVPTGGGGGNGNSLRELTITPSTFVPETSNLWIIIAIAVVVIVIIMIFVYVWYSRSNPPVTTPPYQNVGYPYYQPVMG